MATLYSKVTEIQDLLGHPAETPEFPAEFLTKAIDDSQKVIVTALAIVAEELFPATIFKTYNFHYIPSDAVLSVYLEITGLPSDLLKPSVITLDSKNAHHLKIRRFFESLSYGQAKSQKIWTSWGREKLLIHPATTFDAGKLYYIATPPTLNWTTGQSLDLTVPDELSSLINSFVLIRCKYKIRDYNGAVAAQNLFNNDINLMLKTFQVAPPMGTQDADIKE